MLAASLNGLKTKEGLYEANKDDTVWPWLCPRDRFCCFHGGHILQINMPEERTSGAQRAPGNLTFIHRTQIIDIY